MATKSNKKTKPNKIRFSDRILNKWTGVAVILLVALIGAWKLYSALALPPLPNDDHVLLQLSHAGNQSIRKAADGSIIYDNKSIGVRLMDNRTLLCDNGSTDTYSTTTLSKQEVNDLRRQVEASGILALPSVQTANATAPEQELLDATTIFVRDSKGAKHFFAVAADLPKKPAFTKTENILKKECRKATKRVKNAAINPTPLRLPPAARLVSVEDVTNLVFPQASAASLTGTSGWFTRVEDIMHFVNNAHRINYQGAGKNGYNTGLPHPVNMPALTADGCLTVAARTWAKHMATHNYAHSDLVNWITFFCGRNWTQAAENIGWRSWTGSMSTDRLGKMISEDYLKSKPHHATIDNLFFDHDGILGPKGKLYPRKYRYVGYGAIKANYSDGSHKMFTVQEFLAR